MKLKEYSITYFKRFIIALLALYGMDEAKLMGLKKGLEMKTEIIDLIIYSYYGFLAALFFYTIFKTIKSKAIDQNSNFNFKEFLLFFFWLTLAFYFGFLIIDFLILPSSNKLDTVDYIRFNLITIMFIVIEISIYGLVSIFGKKNKNIDNIINHNVKTDKYSEMFDFFEEDVPVKKSKNTVIKVETPKNYIGSKLATLIFVLACVFKVIKTGITLEFVVTSIILLICLILIIVIDKNQNS